MPKNILDILDDDCIKEIFRNITHVRDYLNAAEVCTRFLQNAMECFPQKFKSIHINVLGFSPIWSLKRLRRFLKLFGHLIRGFQLNFTKKGRQNERVLNLIADACGKTLKNLTVVGQKLNMKTRTPFESLELLHTDGTIIYNFSLHSQIKQLKFMNQSVKDCDWLIKGFAQLIDVEFSGIDDLTDFMLIEFLALNPQIICLKITHCHNLLTTFLPNLVARIPNIGHIHFESKRRDLPMAVEANLIQISKIKNLKGLYISCINLPADTILDSFAHANTNVQCLSLHVAFHRCFRESVLKLTKLRELHVVNINSDDALIRIAKELYLLERLDAKKSIGITFDGIKQVLTFGKKLKQLFISIQNPMSIHVESYESILAMAKNRVEVQLSLEKGRIYIDNDILKANSKWLTVKMDEE